MDTTIDCIPCYLRHVIQISRMVTDDPAIRERMVKAALLRAAKLDFRLPPPAMARELYAHVHALTGIADPYRRIKDDSTKMALALLSSLRQQIAVAEDRFATIVRLVIAGNVIDFGANHDLLPEDVHQAIAEALAQPLDDASVNRLRRAMEHAANILYLGDNCGELVFDRLLIEPYREKVTLAVRGGPVINDATRADIVPSGLDGLVRVIDTGDTAPGIILTHCSDEFRAAFAAADLIIAKGQGNFETIGESRRPIAFLMKAKCQVVARDLGVALGSLVVITRNIT